MWHFLKNGANTIFNKKQEDILSAAFVITVSVAISRILGLVRYRLLAANFGDDIKLLDSFIAASVLPDAIFEVLIFGAIALAFIPLFSQYLGKEKLQRAWQFSSTMITIGLLIFAALTIMIMLTADFIAPLLAPGLVAKEPETQLLIARLLRIMVLAQLFFVISIFFTGILQSFQRFFIPALASVFYNIGIILSIIFLAPVVGIYAPAIGMILGALLHMVVQMPLVLSLGFKFRFNLNFKNQDVKEMLSLVWPRSVALGATRLAELININLASAAALGSIVALSFAQILQLVPIAFFAAPIAQAALPTLSIRFNTQKIEEFKSVFIQSFNQILFLVLPAAAILAILRIPVVRLIFGASEFPWETTVLTGRTLIAFSVGITAAAMALLVTRSFYAIRDSITPVIVNIATVTISISLSLIFVYIFKLSIIWLAIAYSVGNILNFIALLYLLDRKVGHFDREQLLAPAFKMFIITIITAIALYVPMKFLDQLVFDTTRVVGLLLLTAIAGLSGMTVYFALSWFFKVNELTIYVHLLKRIAAFPSKLRTPDPSSIDAQNQTP